TCLELCWIALVIAVFIIGCTLSRRIESMRASCNGAGVQLVFSEVSRGEGESAAHPAVQYAEPRTVILGPRSPNELEGHSPPSSDGSLEPSPGLGVILARDWTQGALRSCSIRNLSHGNSSSSPGPSVSDNKRDIPEETSPPMAIAASAPGVSQTGCNRRDHRNQHEEEDANASLLDEGMTWLPHTLDTEASHHQQEGTLASATRRLLMIAEEATGTEDLYSGEESLRGLTEYSLREERGSRSRDVAVYVMPLAASTTAKAAASAVAEPAQELRGAGPVVVVDNYDSFTYNLCQYLGDLGCEHVVYRNDDITIDDLQKMDPRGVLISPGPGTPDDSGISLDVVRRLGPTVPLFGVCMGLQCMGQAYGGRIVRAPGGVMHGKTSPVLHSMAESDLGLLAGLPSPFTACRYHSLVIEKETFPEDELEVTAWTEDGLVMAVRHKKYTHVEGVQFHPESIITSNGKEIVANFLKTMDRYWAQIHPSERSPPSPAPPSANVSHGGSCKALPLSTTVDLRALAGRGGGARHHTHSRLSRPNPLACVTCLAVPPHSTARLKRGLCAQGPAHAPHGGAEGAGGGGVAGHHTGSSHPPSNASVHAFLSPYTPPQSVSHSLLTREASVRKALPMFPTVELRELAEAQSHSLVLRESAARKALPMYPTVELRELAEAVGRDIMRGNPEVTWSSVKGLGGAKQLLQEAVLKGLGAAKQLLKEAVVMPIKYPQ
ncbi:unnamed protein product, partial [Closterium sp. Naga37s-1]